MIGRHRSYAACLVLLVSLIAGCGGAPETGKLTGQVTFRGQVLDHGMISFYPSRGRPIGVPIQSDGTYRVDLPPDTYGVIVMAPPKLPEGFREGDPLPPPDPNPLPTKYSRRETSGLTAQVVAGNEPQTVDITMN